MKTRHKNRGVKRVNITGLFLAAIMVMTAAGCSRVHEPWDTTDHFKQERTRSADLEKTLRERALHGEVDRSPGIQQVNRT